MLSPIGRVSRSDGSLAILVADAHVARTWKGARSQDYDRACAVLDASPAPFDRASPVGWADSAAGILADLGGAGAAEVFRVAEDELLLAPLHAAPDWSKEIEASFRGDVGSLAARSSARVGTVLVRAALALVWAVEPARFATDAGIATAVTKGVVRRPAGLLASLPPGTYDVVFETMTSDLFRWGIMECRLRIVPTGRTPAVARPAASKPVTTTRTPKRRALEPAHLLETSADAARVESLAFSPDGALLAAGGSAALSATLWRVSTFAQEAHWTDLGPYEFPIEGYRYWMGVSVAFAPESDRLAVATGARVQIRGIGGEIIHRAVFVGTRGPAPVADRVARVQGGIRFERGALVLGRHRFALESLAASSGDAELSAAGAPMISATTFCFSPSGARVYVSYPPRIVDAVHVYDGLASASASNALPAFHCSVVAWSPDERLLALVKDFGNACTIWSLEEGVERARLRNTAARLSVSGVAFRPRGGGADLLALAQSDGAVRLFDTTSWKPRIELECHETRIPETDARGVGPLAFSPDGRWLAVGSGLRDRRGAVAVYDLRDLGD